MEQLLSLDTILHRINLHASQVKACFILGSRLWGTCSKDSDYDLLIVGVAGTTEQYSKQKGLESFSTHCNNGNYDISLMDLSFYQNRIAKGSFLEVVTCFLDGTKYCLLDTIHAKPCAKPSDYLAFVLETTDRDWKFAQKSIEKGHLLRGKKTIVHTLRIVLMLTELIQKNKITDFTLGIENYYLMSSFYEKEWQFYDDYFRPILKEGISELSDLCKS